MLLLKSDNICGKPSIGSANPDVCTEDWFKTLAWNRFQHKSTGNIKIK